MKILVINGPNINLTGMREKGIYGNETYSDICEFIENFASSKGVKTEITQSNHEGAIIDSIHSAVGNFDGIVINAGAYTHYSYAIRDAISAVNLPCVEVHFSNIHGRDEFRTKSVIAPVCKGQIAGFGKFSYCLAIQALLDIKGEN
ncbi:MAG: type II 3-dehydroquinate dehydratase [Oscillospiraceae bacterium]